MTMPTERRPVRDPEGAGASDSQGSLGGARSVWVLCFAVLVLLLGLRNIGMSSRYPYYVLWDMDLHVGLDALEIGSGRLPWQMHHPSFGMNLLIHMTQTIARGLDVIGVSSLADLQSCLNPLAAVAEHVSFIRAHSPWLALLTALALWIALSVAYRPNHFLGFCLLVFLGTQQSLLYHSALVRSELYSVFYWGLAAMAISAVGRSRPGVAWLLSGVAGMLAGLSFLTKLQAVFYVAALPLLAWLWLEPRRDSLRPALDPGSRTTIGAFVLSLMNLLAFSALLAGAQRQPVPEWVFTSTTEYRIQPIAVGLLLGFAGLAWYHGRCLLRGAPGFDFLLSCWLAAMVSGFLASFAFHFLMYADPATALTYLLLDAKVAFLRSSAVFWIQVPSLRHVWDAYGFGPLAYQLHLTALTGVVIGRWSRRLQIGTQEMRLCLALGGCVLLGIVFGTREDLRDLIWTEPLTNLLTAAYLLLLRERVAWRPRTTAAAVAIALLGVTIPRLVGELPMHRRFDIESQLRGWDDRFWLRRAIGGVGGVGAEHFKLMEARYPQDQEELTRFSRWAAADHTGIRRVAEFVLAGRIVTQRSVGVVARGAPVTVQDLGKRIVEYPSELAGAILVDSGSLRSRDEDPIDYDRVWNLRAAASRPVPAGHVVIPRSDLEVLVFVPEGHGADLRKQRVRETDLYVLVRDDREAVRYRGYRVENTRRLVTGRDCFVVIRRHLIPL